ncbi:MAG: Sir2 family NAD-dependent protein deacetylase, partial [Burkholderiaceae bacterium]
KIRFEEMADPARFRADPSLAWGFYGHRLKLYRNTVPHSGFAILRRWAEAKPLGAFVFTSNVDGQFQKAGLADVCEAHGSIHRLQCIDGCRQAVWPADDFQPELDEATCRLLNAPPRCPHCGGIARPNILMFSDEAWVARRTEGQRWELREWLAQGFNLVAIELGAGTAIPTVRGFTEHSGVPYLRINVREPQVRGRLGTGLALGAADALARIDALVSVS